MTSKLFRVLWSARVYVARVAASTYLVLAPVDKQAAYSTHRFRIVDVEAFFKFPNSAGSLNA